MVVFETATVVSTSTWGPFWIFLVGFTVSAIVAMFIRSDTMGLSILDADSGKANTADKFSSTRATSAAGATSAACSSERSSSTSDATASSTNRNVIEERIASLTEKLIATTSIFGFIRLKTKQRPSTTTPMTTTDACSSSIISSSSVDIAVGGGAGGADGASQVSGL